MKLNKLFLMLPILILASCTMVLAQDTTDLFRWTSAPVEQQLTADTTAIPAGQGAIFVPALTRSGAEPEIAVLEGDDLVAQGASGRRILVDPGTYTVRLGSGATNQSLTYDATVKEGVTTTLDVKWGGLRVEVVDEGNIPHRGTYELIRVSDRAIIGTGYGADTLQAETLQTWILPPGVYRIVRPGETYRARSNFSTVSIPERGLVHFKLVTDKANGEFRGAGIVDASELVVGESGVAEGKWTKRVVLGGALALNSTDNVVGQSNQDVFAGTVFFDTYVTYQDGKHFGTGIFEIEEGLVRVDPANGQSLPTQKSQDRLRADVAYVYFTNEKFGPYARFGLLSNVFASDSLVTEDTSVAYNRLDGSRDVLFVPANGDYRTADAFGSLRIREGFGLNVRLLNSRRATANWRVGVGLRQNLFNNAFAEINDPTTTTVDLFEIDEFSEEGVETTFAATVRLGRSLLYITDLEVFADFDETSDPTIDWRNTLSYRLNRFASLDYTLDLLRFPQVIDEDQITQNILLRFSLNIL